MTLTRPVIIIAAVVAAALAVIGVTRLASADTIRLSAEQRRTIHEATKQYRDLDVAVADGYVPVGECAAIPGVGGMGHHYLHPELAGDTEIDPAKPELLVYYEDASGRLRLGAVEYFVADADQDVATDDDRPFLFGEHPLEGPMEGHEEGMPMHYDLHVWLYKHNPAGQLEAWNPKVSCP